MTAPNLHPDLEQPNRDRVDGSNDINACERQEAENAATMSRQLNVLFIVLLVMAGCFTLAWEGLQSAIGMIH